MPRFTLLIPAALCLGLACGLVYVSVPRPEPEWISVSPAVHDFGALAQNTKSEFRYTLTNRHTKPLRIRYAMKDCICTEVVLREGYIEPGGSVEVIVRWNTETRRGRIEASPLVVYSEADEDVKVREVRLRATATVVPDYDVTPRELVPFPRGSRRLDRDANADPDG
jgi:hypothetical protein